MLPYPAFNGENNKQAQGVGWGGVGTERLIDKQLWSFNQKKFTLPVLCFMHICVYEIAIDCFNYMHGYTMVLSQLMCFSSPSQPL